MSIKDYYADLNKITVTLGIHLKNFKELGYWLRDIKNRIGKRRILDIEINFKIVYTEDYD